MNTTTQSGVFAPQKGLLGAGKKQWGAPVVLALSAAVVIGLLIFGLQQRTEAQLLKMRYQVENVQAGADARVLQTQKELHLVMQKFDAVQAAMEGLQKKVELVQRTSAAASSKPAVGKPIGKPRGTANPPKGGMEDLRFGTNIRLSDAADDPVVGFSKGDLL